MEDLFQEYNNSVIKVEAATGEEITSIEELRKYKSKDSLNLLKQSIECSTAKKNKIFKYINQMEKHFNESLLLIQELKELLTDKPIEKPVVPKTTAIQKRINVINIHEPFFKEHLIKSGSNMVDEPHIKSTLKQFYFEKNKLKASTQELNVESNLNIPSHDVDIINKARSQDKDGLYPTTKDIPTIIKFLEKRYETIIHEDRIIDLNNPYSIMKDITLFTPVFEKNEEKYKITSEFCNTLSSYGINISNNKLLKSKAIDDIFKNYLTINKKLFIKIDIQYEKYIDIINNGDEKNYLISDNIIYMNKLKFDEVLKQSKNETGSEFKPSIVNEFRNQGLMCYNVQTFKSKIENSYK
jgi:hypothetical protein